MAFGTDPNDTAGDFVLRFLIASQATERQGALSTSAAAELGALLDAPRRMAHERVPPPGYVEAFDPNVTVVDGVVTVRPRAVPLTAERVRAIEAEWRDKVRRGALPR